MKCLILAAGLGTRLVLRENPSGDQVDRCVRAEVVGWSGGSHGHHPGSAVRVGEPLREHPRGAWVVGGGLGIALPLVPEVGFGVISGLLVVVLVLSMQVRRARA